MRRDAFWSGLEAGIAALLSLITSFAIARIVGPEELGVGAAATAVHVILWVMTNALFADALVQRPTVDDPTLSSAFWAGLGAGTLALLAETAAGFWLAWLMRDTRMTPMALAMGLSLPLVGAASTIQGLLTRERAYRQLALRTLIGQGIGTIAGVVAATQGAGGWALVSQQAIGSMIGALTLLIGRGWRPSRTFSPALVRDLLRTGVPLTASTLVLIARYRIFAVLIGGSAGAAVLGQVHLAFRLVDTVRELIFTALWRLILPAMADVQHDTGALLAQVDRWLRWCGAIILPLCIALGVILSQFVAVLMGPSWGQASQATLPLLVLMAWSALTFPSGVALVAVGQARFTLYANLGGMLTAAAGVTLMPPSDPWSAVTIWTISQMLISPYSLWINARALGVGLLRPLTGGFRVQPTVL